MWHNTRRGHNLIRKRNNERKLRINIATISIAVVCVIVLVSGCIGVYNFAINNNNKSNVPVIETNASENLETSKNDSDSNTNFNNDKQENTDIEDKENSDNIVDLDNNEVTSQENTDKIFKVSFLGEIMMGGNIGELLNYNYMSAFRSIVEYTNNADYTVLNLGTNIIDLDKIENSKSKYIVTKNIENAFYALGIDGINIASDHMLDFGKDIFKDTIDIINNDYDLIGLKDTIVYAEHNGIKIAIIGVCNEVIGSQGKYENAGIMMYNLEKIKSMIKDAKKHVNTVVLLTHLGLENTHNITNVMTWFYKELIDAGADIVLGSHALGVFPIEIYKGKPIVYSMGDLMSDTDYSYGKETGIFSINVDEKGYLKSLEILPLYIKDKTQTMLYKLYDKTKYTKFLNSLVEKIDKDSYEIYDDKVVINIEK